jgi:hypothetical protein
MVALHLVSLLHFSFIFFIVSFKVCSFSISYFYLWFTGYNLRQMQCSFIWKLAVIAFFGMLISACCIVLFQNRFDVCSNL